MNRKLMSIISTMLSRGMLTKNYSKEKASWKNKKHLLRYLANLTRTEPEEQEIDRQNTEPIAREGTPV